MALRRVLGEADQFGGQKAVALADASGADQVCVHKPLEAFPQHLGRDGFRGLFGYGPEEFRHRRDGIDFARFDEFVPHPVYGTQGWASVVNPGPRTAEEVDRLLRYEHKRGSRHRRA